MRDCGLLPSASTAAVEVPAMESPAPTPTTSSQPRVTVKLSDEALAALTRWYAREAGVRNLQKLIDRIYRKVALEVVEKESSSSPQTTTTTREITISEADLEKYVGKRKYAKERLFGDNLSPGIVMGLAYNGEGGAALYVEATALPTTYANASSSSSSSTIKEGGGGGGSIQSTGRMGDTMKESTSIAFTNVKRELLKQFPAHADFFEKHHIHLHVPDGATPKDGGFSLFL